jgi:hypothetical protein
MLDNISPMKLAKIRNIPEDEIDTRLPVAGNSRHPFIVRLKKQQRFESLVISRNH